MREPINKKISELVKTSQNLFHTQDLALLWGIENKNTLHTTIKRYVDRNILIRIKKGFYSKVPIEELDPVKLGAGFLHSFCYLSTETILFREGVVSQPIPYFTFVSSRSKRFEAGGHHYLSRQMKDEYLFNEAGVLRKDGVKQALLERAVADMIYFSPNYHFDAPNLVDWDKVSEVKEIIGYK